MKPATCPGFAFSCGMIQMSARMLPAFSLMFAAVSTFCPSALADQPETQQGLPSQPPEMTADALQSLEIPPAANAAPLRKPTSSPPSRIPPVSVEWVLIGSSDGGLKSRDSLHKVLAPSPAPDQPLRQSPAVALKKYPTNPSSTRNISKKATATAQNSGDRKATMYAPPVKTQVTHVHWTAQNTSADSCRIRQNVVTAFNHSECPLVSWSQPATLPSPAVSPRLSALADPEITEPGPAVTASAVADITPVPANSANIASVLPYTDDLRSILPAPANEFHRRSAASTNSTVGQSAVASTYLDELEALLRNQSVWVVARDSVLDITPSAEEAEGRVFLSDLKSLVPQVRGTAAAVPPVHPQYFVAAAQPVLQPQSAPADLNREAPSTPRRSYTIAPDPMCEVVGGSGIASLFQPIGHIQLSGSSTTPPELPRRMDTASGDELKRPNNDACAYLEAASPGFYFTPPRHHVSRPPRNTHQLWHNPLYFEDPNLERCGQSSGCLTNAVSAVHFGGTVVFAPYLMTLKPPRSCVQALPDCPTCHEFGAETYFPAWSWRAAAVQAATVTGLVFVIP